MAWLICPSFASLISATRDGTVDFSLFSLVIRIMRGEYDRGKTGLGEIEPIHDASNSKIPEICWKYFPQYFHTRPRTLTLSSSTVTHSRILYFLFYRSDIRSKTSSAYRVSCDLYSYLWALVFVCRREDAVQFLHLFMPQLVLGVQ